MNPSKGKQQEVLRKLLACGWPAGWGVIGVAVGMSIDLMFRGAIFLWRLKSQKWTRFQVI